jgi:hypothetical protein
MDTIHDHEFPVALLKSVSRGHFYAQLNPAPGACFLVLRGSTPRNNFLHLIPGFIGTTNLTATPRRPACPSRASSWSSLTTPWGFPCCVHSPCVHAAATTPAQRLGYSSLVHPAVSAFPERVIGSACALSVSRLAQRLLTLRPAHSRCHRFVTRYPKASDPM